MAATLTTMEWAYICTIHHEPKYQFIAEELRMARKMAKKGLLTELADKMFAVTKDGERQYKNGCISENYY